MSAERNKQLVEETVKLIDDRNYERLKEMKLTLNRIFGAERNQIVKVDILPQVTHLHYPERSFNSHLESSLRDFLRYELIIHFPEVIISNDNDNSHKIRDIYVRISLTPGLLVKGSLYGLRTTFTRNEWKSNYTHSHLSGLCTTFSEFCTGVGPINQVLYALSSEYDPINFEMLCYHIQIFLEHESLEGTPFEYFEKIGTGNYSIKTLNSDTHGEVLNYIYRRYMQVTDVPHLKTLLRVTFAEQVTVDPTDELEKELAGLLIQLRQNAPRERSPLVNVPENHLIVHKVGPDVYTTILSESSLAQYDDPEILTFKGEPKRLNILIHPDIEIQRIYYANPSITRYICRSLAKSIARTGVTFKGTEPSGNHFAEPATAESDTVLMLAGA